MQTETSSSEQSSTHSLRMTAPNIPSTRPGAQRTSTSTTVLFVHYPYLKVHSIHSIAQQDLNYMEAQGCLHVPTRPILDNFVEQYFRHHNPLIPLLNEGDFWEMYSQKESTGPQATMSLLVFQAMLFASCNVSISFLLHSLIRRHELTISTFLVRVSSHHQATRFLES